MNYQPTANGLLVPQQAMPRPLATYDDRPGDRSRDFAGSGSFSQYALERMLQGCADQPLWRMRAALCAAYYDGKQLDALRQQLLRAEGLDERVVNLIRPIINSVLGQEARSRTDVRIDYDDDGMAEVAEFISGRLKEAERKTNAHAAVSDAYASEVKKGLGWLHVCRNADPLAYPYRFEAVDTDEVWWDWLGMGKDTRMTDKVRWLCRMRMIDLDEIMAGMPEHRDVLERCASGWLGGQIEHGGMLGEPDNLGLTEAFGNELRFATAFHKLDWFDSARRMVKLIEVWYRVPAIAVCLEISPTNRVLYNPKDPRHVMAVSRGLVPLVKGPTSQVRRALYAGPHRLLDEATTRKAFPYIPLFAYRDDEDCSPYGMIDGMVAPQDDYNDRRHRIQWMLKARQVQMDSDAVDERFNSIADIADTDNRPDFVAVTNPNRANKNQEAIKIGNTLSMQKEQFDLLGIAEADVQKSAGRYGSNLGSAQVQSGIANSLLIEQGEQSMGELNDNYVYARRSAFEQLVDLIIEDHSKPDMRVAIGQGHRRRTIVLNTFEPEVDPQTQQPVGPPMPKNMVAEADIRTALAETPSSPAFRAQAQNQLKEILTAMGNNAQALSLLAPAYIESSSLENRQELADDLRRMSGLPTPGDRTGRQQAETSQRQQAAQNAQLLQQKAVADVKGADAETSLRIAQADKIRAEAEALHRKNAMGQPEAEAAAAHIANATSAVPGEEDPNGDQAANDAVQGALADVSA